MRFNIICETDEDGKYVVECTDLPGCLSEGDTLDEAMWKGSIHREQFHLTNEVSTHREHF
ncbi:MAG: hypothetical protein GQ533_04855 [Methanosarcinaceae archaeon]|nr:hypothetical protein [Methanosarcinaceae archaeon]